MEKWYTNWRFKINQDKSYHTTFTVKMAPCPNVTLYGIQIPSSQTVKYLGFLLDRSLIWAKHIKSKRLQLNNRLRTLSSLLHKIHTHKHQIDNIQNPSKTHLDLRAPAGSGVVQKNQIYKKFKLSKTFP